MDRLTTLIVDDVELARQKIVRALAEFDDVEVIGEAADAAAMIEEIDRLRPKLVFLDISMPEQDGISAISEVPEASRPLVIFLTAHSHFALEAFRVDAVDYLLKPVNHEALSESLSRARRRLGTVKTRKDYSKNSESSSPRMSLPTNDGERVILIQDIDWIESVKNHIAVHVKNEAIIVRSTLYEFLQKLDPKHFIRVHRSAAINVQRVTHLRPLTNGDQRVSLANGVEINVSRTFREDLLRSLRR